MLAQEQQFLEVSSSSTELPGQGAEFTPYNGVLRFAIRRRREGDSGVKIFRGGNANEEQDRASPAGHAAHARGR